MATPALAQPARPPSAQAQRTPRVLSIDLLRGLDVLLMLFVNEMAGVRGTPAFLRHVPANADGMTITDVVFPAFLFITGMAIPLALAGRINRGESRASIWRHVLTRSLALIVIGVFMVNAEHGSAPGVLSPDWWNVVMTIAVLLVWHVRPSPARGRQHRVLVFVGLLLLVAVAFLYRSSAATGLIQLRPQWWGILGLIGWAYLVASSVYLLTGDKPAVLLISAAVLYALYFLDELGIVPWLAQSEPFIGVGSTLGSHAALVVTGTVLTVIIRRHHVHGRTTGAVVWRAIGYGAGLGVAGMVLHAFRDIDPAFWINKPHATPAWCLVSAALTCAVWALVYFLVDIKGWRRWPKAVAIAGEQALLAYLLAPLLLSLMALSAGLFGVNPYGVLGRDLIVGTVRSMVFAWLVVRLCGWLRGAGIRLQV
jgi:heparan-alpha-glucosaminide N-acetyltransferase